MKDTWVVIMFEPRYEGEPEMTLTEQVNEVFGPFESSEKAEAWLDRMLETFKAPRQWLVAPLSCPSVVRHFGIHEN